VQLSRFNVKKTRMHACMIYMGGKETGETKRKIKSWDRGIM